MHIHFLKFLLLLPLVLLTGCASYIQSQTDSFAAGLSASILNHPDPKTIEQALPTYLVLLDSLIEKSPNDAAMLRQGASLYVAYAGLFVNDKERQQRLTKRALHYSSRAICEYRADTCALTDMKFAPAMARITSMTMDDLPYFYTLGETWAAWIQAHSSDWNAVAQLAQVKGIMQTIVQRDQNFERGGGHLYLGILNTLLPPAMGGKPEVGRQHFERAIEIAEQRNLMQKVAFARHYARLVYDQLLHDKLLQEVLSADPAIPGFTLINTLAQLQAKSLLESAEDFF